MRNTIGFMPEPEVAMGPWTVNILPIATNHFVLEQDGKTFEIVDEAEAARRTNPLLELTANEPAASIAPVEESPVDPAPSEASAKVVALRVEPDPDVHWSVPRRPRE